MVVSENTIEKMEHLPQDKFNYVIQLVDWLSIPAPAKNIKENKRIGVAKGKFTIADDFNRHDDEIASMFEDSV